MTETEIRNQADMLNVNETVNYWDSLSDDEIIKKYNEQGSWGLYTASISRTATRRRSETPT